MPERQNEVVSVTALEKVPGDEEKRAQTQVMHDVDSAEEIQGKHMAKVSSVERIQFAREGTDCNANECGRGKQRSNKIVECKNWDGHSSVDVVDVQGTAAGCGGEAESENWRLYFTVVAVIKIL